MTYEVVGVLGRGGSAVVELALDPSGRQVATKRVPLAGPAGAIEEARRRLRREAEILRRLDHPAIVPVLDVVDDGTDVVLVLPVLAETLEERVARLGPLPPDEVAEVGRALLSALVAAHRAGVVHRDVKPVNVLLDAGGRAALADFGVAACATVLTAGLTADGAPLGTPGWAAPEQARGEEAGPAADVFSLAATLAWAAGAGAPYGAGPAPVLWDRAVRGIVCTDLGLLPAGVGGRLAGMLDPDPARRPSAAAVLGGPAGTLAGAATLSTGTLLGAATHSGTGTLAGAATHSGTGTLLDPRASSGTGAPGDGGTLPLALPGAPPAAGTPAPGHPGRRRVLLGVAAAGGIACVAAAALVAGGLAGTGPLTGRRAAAGAPRAACSPARYQPCGGVPAPHTDGTACDPGWYDLDGSAANGCEARSDYRPGSVLVAGQPLRANLVPLTATDAFSTHVAGDALALCWGQLQVTLTAPPRTAEAVTVAQGGEVLARAVSAGGSPATAAVPKPSCFGGDAEDLTVQVSLVAATGGASARDFTLTRNGGW